MMSGHVSILPARGLDESDSGIEQKFLFAAARRGLLLDWLEFHLVRDPKFYFSPIVSLYYDTPSLRLYDEVRNGDYLKTKVRLRWYQKEFSPEQQTVSCFFEIKRKFGSRRQKHRKPLALDPRWLHGDLFSNAGIRDVPDALPEWRLLVKGVLVPLLVIDYERFRFIEPRSGTRISLDTGIRCSRADSAYVAGTAPAALEFGVLEVKGALDTLPRCLRPVERYLRKQSFSKYARCCELLLNPLSVRTPL